MHLIDHSGLGGDARISADDMVKLLVHARPGGALQAHMKEVAPQNEKGEPLRGAPFTIHAKTGTLNFVSALTGYVTPSQGRPLAFAIFSADTERRARIPREEMERPAGARGWSRRSRWLQYQLVNRWAGLYSA
jgi:D-alanyl-D-alanine carboxypeptidase/D-alanyl-D-alanine-endopeptidase (penicillin-binding protein 4)